MDEREKRGKIARRKELELESGKALEIDKVLGNLYNLT